MFASVSTLIGAAYCGPIRTASNPALAVRIAKARQGSHSTSDPKCSFEGYRLRLIAASASMMMSGVGMPFDLVASGRVAAPAIERVCECEVSTSLRQTRRA